MGIRLGVEPCPKCRQNGGDSAGDNLNVYDDGKWCYKCNYSEFIKGVKSTHTGIEEDVKVDPSKFITTSQIKKLKEITSYDKLGVRGINQNANAFYGVRTEYDQETGTPTKRYYPNTIDGKPSGYKVRMFPKTFVAPKGYVGAKCDLFGQCRYKEGQYKTLIIVGGEEDCLAGYQMVYDFYLTKKDQFDKPFAAVVSSSLGESAYKQFKQNYKFINSFDKIIIGLDADDAGREAVEKIVPYMPRGKVFIAKWPKEDDDPNTILLEGRQKEFINALFRADKYIPAGIKGSGDLYQAIVDTASTPKLTLPSFMATAQEMLDGGIPTRCIVNIFASSGCGKTSIVNEMVYYWVFNSPHLLGVVSLELNAGQYGTAMLSRHIGFRITSLKTPEEKLKFLDREDIIDKSEELFKNEDGTSRWHLIDDRDGTIQQVQNIIEELIISLGCKVIVLDPLQDLLDGMSNEEQAIFMRWQKSMLKSHDIIFININHIRKSSNGQEAGSGGREAVEEDIHGHSSIYKSGGINIGLARDKYAADPVDRNTVKIRITKSRESGNTGPAGEAFYDNKTHTLHDKNYYFEVLHPEEWDAYLRRLETNE